MKKAAILGGNKLAKYLSIELKKKNLKPIIYQERIIILYIIVNQLKSKIINLKQLEKN